MAAKRKAKPQPETRLLTTDPDLVAAIGGAMMAATGGINPFPDETRGAYLCRMRQARGLTRAELADILGFGLDAVTMAEDFTDRLTGDDIDGFWRLAADALNLPEDTFLSVPVTIAPAPPRVDGGIVNVAYDRLRPGFNPRRTFDVDEIATLAEAIAAQGLLQNLVGSAGGDGTVFVAAGGRRWRAIGLLVEQGRWDATAANIPVKLVAAEEAELVIISILENLARVDVNAMEEADGFAYLQSLDPDRWTTRAIAEKTGHSMRKIQQRLKLLTGLVNPAQDALREGIINFGQARAIYQAPNRGMQQMIIADIKAGGQRFTSVAGIRAHVTTGMIPIARARFNIADYEAAAEGRDDMEIVEFDDGARFLPSRDLFMELQAEWADRQPTTHRAAGWAWAEVAPTFHHYKYDRVEGMAPGAGVVIVMDPGTGAVTEHVGLIPKPAIPAPAKQTVTTWSPRDIAPASAAPAPPPAPVTPADIPDQARTMQIWAMQQREQQGAVQSFRAAIGNMLARHPMDVMLLMILDQGRPDTDSLFERRHSNDCFLLGAHFHDDDGEPGPLAAAAEEVWSEDNAALPSESACTFHDRDAMAAALLKLIHAGDAQAIARFWADMVADTIFIQTSTCHPVWREYARLRAIPLPAHFRAAQLDIADVLTAEAAA